MIITLALLPCTDAAMISKFRKKVATAAIAAAPLMVMTQQTYAAQQYRSEGAVKNVARVYYSLGNVYDDIEKNGADATTVRKQVNALLTNYKLKDNIRKTLDDIEGGGRRKDEAYTHGISCIEDLALISEYFEDEIDNESGRKTPARETLQVAEKAVVAARTELETFINYVPYGKATLSAIKTDEFSY